MKKFKLTLSSDEGIVIDCIDFVVTENEAETNECLNASFEEDLGGMLVTHDEIKRYESMDDMMMERIYESVYCEMFDK